MRRSASEVIKDLEQRIARLERSAAPRPTPPGVWEEFGDTRKQQEVSSLPSASRIDVTPRKYDFDALCIELADGLSRGGKGNALYKKMRSGDVKVHLFKLLAEYGESVPVSRTYPDGGATYVLYEAYYTSPKTGELVKSYLRVESMIIAGGSFVGGKILNQSQANNFLAAAKRDGWDIKDYL